MSVQARLQEFAKSKCLPYLMGLPQFKSDLDRLTFLLVGSAADGLCREDSDVDIAIVCDEDTYEQIAKGQQWYTGRPSEAQIDGVQLHYYGISFQRIESKLRELDDVYLYVYSNGIVLAGSAEAYRERLGGLLASIPQVRKERLEGKLDMLMRRSRALRSGLGEQDIYVLAAVYLEVMALCLKVIALLDDVPFDPRKRLFSMALAGPTGRKVEDQIRQLFCDMGDLGCLKHQSDFDGLSFRQRMAEIVDSLSAEACKQGFRVRLDRPDRRHIEK